MDARRGIFRRDGLVAEVQAETVPFRLADYAGQDQRGVQKIQVGQTAAVAKIPKHASAGRAFHLGTPGVKRKRGSAARHQRGNGQAGGLQPLAQAGHRRKGRLAFSPPFLEIGRMQMPVVSMKAGCAQTRPPAKLLVKLPSIFIRGHSGAMLAAINVKYNIELL